MPVLSCIHSIPESTELVLYGLYPIYSLRKTKFLPGVITDRRRSHEILEIQALVTFSSS